MASRMTRLGNVIAQVGEGRTSLTVERLEELARRPEGPLLHPDLRACTRLDLLMHSVPVDAIGAVIDLAVGPTGVPWVTCWVRPEQKDDTVHWDALLCCLHPNPLKREQYRYPKLARLVESEFDTFPPTEGAGAKHHVGRGYRPRILGFLDGKPVVCASEPFQVTDGREETNPRTIREGWLPEKAAVFVCGTQVVSDLDPFTGCTLLSGNMLAVQTWPRCRERRVETIRLFDTDSRAGTSYGAPAMRFFKFWQAPGTEDVLWGLEDVPDSPTSSLAALHPVLTSPLGCREVDPIVLDVYLETDGDASRVLLMRPDGLYTCDFHSDSRRHVIGNRLKRYVDRPQCVPFARYLRRYARMPYHADAFIARRKHGLECMEVHGEQGPAFDRVAWRPPQPGYDGPHRYWGVSFVPGLGTWFVCEMEIPFPLTLQFNPPPQD